LHSFYERAAVHQQYTQQSLKIRPIRLGELLKWGESPVTEQKLIESAEFIRIELPKRLAKRVLAIQQLPFIVGLNPHIRSVYLLYQDSYYKIQEYPRIETMEHEQRFTEMLAESVDSHSQVIPSLARGILECKRYMSHDQITQFLNDTIEARIGKCSSIYLYKYNQQESEYWLNII
jgi:hypothetical protein